MKIQIVSDLHLELIKGRESSGPTVPYVEGADVLVLAGDIHRGARAIDAFKDWPVPVVYVGGNHEHYKQHIWKNLDDLRDRSIDSCVRFLECQEWIYRDVRFLGCSLWTDYELYGNPELAMEVAAEGLNDHHVIKTHYRGFRPSDALAIHRDTRRWLEERLQATFDGKTVVVTHHAPHSRSIEEQYVGSELSPAFASDLTALMGSAELWLHGHVHESVDYEVKGTRVVANPRGYVIHTGQAKDLSQMKFENTRFNPSLVVEV